MKLKHCLSVIGMFLALAMSAQENTPPAVIDVEGIEPGMTISYSDFVKKFGKPDKYRSYDSDYGVSEDYEIHGCEFHCEENGILYNFYIEDSRYRILTHYFKDGVRIGDDFSVLDALEPDFVRKFTDGAIQYVLFKKISECVLYVNVKQGKIESVFFNLPV